MPPEQLTIQYKIAIIYTNTHTYIGIDVDTSVRYVILTAKLCKTVVRKTAGLICQMFMYHIYLLNLNIDTIKLRNNQSSYL